MKIQKQVLVRVVLVIVGHTKHNQAFVKSVLLVGTKMVKVVWNVWNVQKIHIYLLKQLSLKRNVPNVTMTVPLD